MKKKQVEVLPALTGTFATQVKELAADASDLSKSYADLTKRMLKFAHRFHELWEEARRLDGNKDNGQHAAHFHQILGSVVNTQNRSIWSRWNTIGKYTKQLVPHAVALPPQRDALYELALATKEGKRVGTWIENKKLTSESSFREVVALCKKKTRATTKPGTSKNCAAVTLYFKDYDHAAKALQEIVTKAEVISIDSHEAFRQAIKGLLGPTYAQVADRLQ
ncbi:MAG: hypothetical protein OEU68_04245 [Nitrospira sp.]|nr:hypothetical protein [Nitrospira sp.]MDH4242714.1 hypothetical protein [Nitrospira sp.]MDH4355017.1 hypothetical protein [Nitrospira sp.]MDH5316997.1 hypothetical protein [Nitrospira sp.]